MALSDLLEARVLERELLAAHRGEAHGHERVAPAPLDADDEPLPPTAVTDARPDLERQVVAARVELRLLDGGVAARLAPRGAEERQVLLGHLEQEARRLAEAVAVHPPVERVGDREALLRARAADVAEAPLLLDLVGRGHRARV